jgi:hypothetical protein
VLTTILVIYQNSHIGSDATNVPGVDTSLHCVAMAEKGADDGLVATGDEEDIWAYINFD